MWWLYIANAGIKFEQQLHVFSKSDFGAWGGGRRGTLICICLKYKIFDKWILSTKLELPGVVIFCFICYGTNIESVDAANFGRWPLWHIYSNIDQNSTFTYWSTSKTIFIFELFPFINNYLNSEIILWFDCSVYKEF